MQEAQSSLDALLQLIHELKRDLLGSEVLPLHAPHLSVLLCQLLLLLNLLFYTKAQGSQSSPPRALKLNNTIWGHVQGDQTQGRDACDTLYG